MPNLLASIVFSVGPRRLKRNFSISEGFLILAKALKNKSNNFFCVSFGKYFLETCAIVPSLMIQIIRLGSVYEDLFMFVKVW